MTQIPNLPVAYNLVQMETVDSTNEEAKKLAKLGESKAPDGTLVWALSQTKGRGRANKKWHSPKGNLYFSLILRPDICLNSAAQLSFVTAVALCGAIGEVCEPGIEVYCKWPNDILLYDRKVAGILLETEGDSHNKVKFVIIGAGVNLAHFPEISDFPATSLVEEGQAVPDIKMLEAFTRHFMDWANRWMDDGFEHIRLEWKRLAKGIGKEVQVNHASHSEKGVFVDLDPNGALILEQSGQMKSISAGSMIFCPT